MALAKSKSIAASPKRPDAMALAAKVSADTQNDITIIVDAKQINDRGPLVIALDLADDFTDEELSSMPIVGSREKDDKGNILTNNPDIIVISKPTAKGGSIQSDHSWYDDFADSMGIGLDWSKQAKDLRAIKNDQKTADKDGATTLLAKVEGRLKANRQKIKRAVAYVQQYNNFVELLDDTIGVYLAMEPEQNADGSTVKDKDGNDIDKPSKSPSPIKIWDKSPEGLNKNTQAFISLTTFLSFDVFAAAKNGGSWVALYNTIKKEPTTPDGQKPLAFKDAEATATRFIKLLEQDNIDKAFAREVGKKDTGKVVAHTMFTLMLLLQSLCEPWRDLYQQVEDEATAKMVADRAALTASASK